MPRARPIILFSTEAEKVLFPKVLTVGQYVWVIKGINAGKHGVIRELTTKYVKFTTNYDKWLRSARSSVSTFNVNDIVKVTKKKMLKVYTANIILGSVHIFQ